MRVLQVMGMLLALCVGLCGCQISGEVENQAYVLVLGVDRLEGGALELTASVPQIGQREQSGEKEEGGRSPYLLFSVVSDSYAHALEALQLATPRQINLSHIGLLIVSEALAGEHGFPALIDAIANTPHLYATAPLVVCEGSARAFIESQETIIGTRLSEELKAMLHHYVAQGYIPESSLAEVSYAASSIYSDPVAIYGQLEQLWQGGDLSILNSPMKQRFAGSVVFRDGRLARRLDLDETRLLCLSRGSAKKLRIDNGGAGCELILRGKPRRSVDIDQDTVTLRLALSLSCADAPAGMDLLRAEASFEEGLRLLIAECQQSGVDPFGFADAAAGHFLTISQWQAFEWRNRFRSAQVEVKVDIVP